MNMQHFFRSVFPVKQQKKLHSRPVSANPVVFKNIVGKIGLLKVRGVTYEKDFYREVAKLILNQRKKNCYHKHDFFAN